MRWSLGAAQMRVWRRHGARPRGTKKQETRDQCRDGSSSSGRLQMSTDEDAGRRMRLSEDRRDWHFSRRDYGTHVIVTGKIGTGYDTFIFSVHSADAT